MVINNTVKKIIIFHVLFFSFFFVYQTGFSQENNNEAFDRFNAESLLNNDFTDGYIRVILNRRRGTFTLNFLNETRGRLYEPLFYPDSRTTFLTVFADDNIYKPATSRRFTNRIERVNGVPSLVFESSFMLIRQSFTPVRTTSSEIINGVQVTISVTNKRNTESFIGIRQIIDTHLGEERGRVPFITNERLILNEQIIRGRGGTEYYWISRGNYNSLMGSIVNPLDPTARRPDYVHFSNWKRLTNAKWEADYRENRRFNYLPYSINDSAVAYHYRPVLVRGGGTFSVSYFLTTADPAWYDRISMAPRRTPPPSPVSPSDIKEPEIDSPIEIEIEEEEIIIYDEEELEIEIIDENIYEEDYEVIVGIAFIIGEDEELESEPQLEIEIEVEPEYQIEIGAAFIMEEEWILEIEDYITLDNIENDITDDLKNELMEAQKKLQDFLKGEIELTENDLLEIEQKIIAIRESQNNMGQE